MCAARWVTRPHQTFFAFCFISSPRLERCDVRTAAGLLWLHPCTRAPLMYGPRRLLLMYDPRERSTFLLFTCLQTSSYPCVT